MPNVVRVPANGPVPAHRVEFNALLPRLFGAGAMTPLPGLILVSGDRLSKRLHAHEAGHLLQIESLGWPRFVARYLREIHKPHGERFLEQEADLHAPGLEPYVEDLP